MLIATIAQASGASKKSVRDVISRPLRNGVSPSSSGTFEASVLTLSSITRGRFDPTAVKMGTFAREHDPDKLVQQADFLVCRGNGNKSLVGVGALVTEDMKNTAFPDTIISVVADEEIVDLRFLEESWRTDSVRQQIEQGARTTNGTFKINQTMIESVELLLPSIADQRKFGQWVAGLDRVTQAMEHHLAKLDELFASLQHRAFRGEL